MLDITPNPRYNMTVIERITTKFRKEVSKLQLLVRMAEGLCHRYG